MVAGTLRASEGKLDAARDHLEKAFAGDPERPNTVLLLLNVDLPKQGPGYLALASIDEGLARAVQATDKDVLWFEKDRRLTLAASTARISLPSDTSFNSYASALALLHGPRLRSTEYVFWNQGYFDAHLEYPIESPSSTISLEFRVSPGLRDRLKLDLRFLTADGRERAFELSTSQGAVNLDPRWYQAAATFVVSGFGHVILGPDGRMVRYETEWNPDVYSKKGRGGGR